MLDRCIVSFLSSLSLFFFFLMIRRPPRSTLDRSSAASDVYKRQDRPLVTLAPVPPLEVRKDPQPVGQEKQPGSERDAVSYTHLRAHETVLDLVCRLLLEKKTN